MRLLVLDDDKVTRESVTQSLVHSGFSVDAAALSSQVEKMVLNGKYDALIVDLTLRDRDGVELIQRLRAQGVSAPVLILSTWRSVDELVSVLDKGADDYITKPFAFPELLARLRVLLRRSGSARPETTRLRLADLEVDLIRREALRDGKQIHLTQQEFALLEYLVRNSGRVVTRAMLLDHVWKIRINTSSNIVDVHIHRLRQKVDEDKRRPLIRTIRGVGYVLID